MDLLSSPQHEATLAPPRAGNPWRGVLVYTILVILFGAVVRITGSGAGCGQHWPTCNGEVLHLPQTTETVIELTHRVTSALSGLLVFGLTLLAFRDSGRGHLLRTAAVVATVFMIAESLVGAGLVKFALVGQNESVARAVVMALHLVNTLGLTGAMSLAAWAYSRRDEDVRFAPGLGYWMGAIVLLVVSAAGAVTALGDTLYPVAPSVSHVMVGDSPTAHFLERVRGVHPMTAVLGSGIVWWLAGRVNAGSGASFVRSMLVVQMLLGLVNVALSAPAYMKVIHLGAAVVLWVAWVRLAVSLEGLGQPLPPQK